MQIYAERQSSSYNNRDMGTYKSRVETLENQGWTKRFEACEPRLSEAVAMYKEAGFEVHLEPLSTEVPADDGYKEINDARCRTCFEGLEDRYRIIFTKKDES